MLVNPYDRILDQQGIKYENLSPEERALCNQDSNGVKAITVEDLTEQISELLFSLQLDLCDTPDTPENQDKNKYLKARVKNYLVMLAFLTTPVKVAKAIEKSIQEGKS